eukprot:7191469-Prymnesium_polylepis.1
MCVGKFEKEAHASPFHFVAMSSALAALRAAADALRTATALAAADVTAGLALCDDIANLLAAR